MLVKPILFNGMVQRTQDVSTLKQNEQNKPIFEQQNMQTKLQKDTMHNLQHIREGEDAQQQESKYDAREKGKNEYSGQRGKKKQKDNKNTQGTVVKKMAKNSFDIKI